MKKLFSEIIKTATWKHSQITIIGTSINGILGALFYIFMARFLGPSDFGLLILSISILTLIADMVDFGTNTGLIRYVSANIRSDEALKFLKLGLEFKIVIWILVLILGFFLSPFIASYIFKKIELITSLRLVMVGVGGLLLLSFVTSTLQAFQKYFVWSFVNISNNSIRLLVVLILFLFGQLNLTSGLLSYIILPFFGFSLGLLFLPYKKMFAIAEEFSVAKKLFKYNFWVGIFTIIAAISSRLDTFLTARLLSNFQLGIYGAANQLVQVVPQLVGALGVVAAPKFASFTNNSDMIRYFKKFQFFVLGLSVLGLISIPISIYLIPILFGVQYLSASGPFIILLLAMIIFLISVPIHNSIIFYFARPSLFVWVALGHLLIIGWAGYFLISNYGVIGAATTVLIGMIFNFLIPLLFFLKKVSK